MHHRFVALSVSRCAGVLLRVGGSGGHSPAFGVVAWWVAARGCPLNGLFFCVLLPSVAGGRFDLTVLI